ncbi:unnamed protein product [Calypogeia fissa]
MVPGSMRNVGNAARICLGCEKQKQQTMKAKKHTPRASIKFCCWVTVVSLLFLVLACPGLDPLERKYETLRYAASFERQSFIFDSCKGKRIFMYDLPPEFNIAVNDVSRCNRSLIAWMDLCPRFTNDGYGLKLWSEENGTQKSADDDFDTVNFYETDSYTLEKIFHMRMQKYRCLTTDPSQANAFFVPFYTGLVALDPLYDMTDAKLTYEKRANFGHEVLEWLAENGGEYWSRFEGRDHFLIKGRTGWDFKIFYPDWGTGFSELPYSSNMTSLLIERRPKALDEIGIPYPTAFHPESPQRLQTWIEKVESSERKYLFSYVGAPRPDRGSVMLRETVGNACINAGKDVCNLVNCLSVKCSHDPVSIYKAFLSAHFCLQPPGDSATRRSTFDCLIAGSIPVFFDNDTAYIQYFWHLPQDPKSYSVFISKDDLKNGVSIEEVWRCSLHSKSAKCGRRSCPSYPI